MLERLAKTVWIWLMVGVLALLALAALQTVFINLNGTAPTIIAGPIGFLCHLASEIGRAIGWRDLAHVYRSSQGPVFHSPTTDKAWPYWWWVIGAWMIIPGAILLIVYALLFIQGWIGGGHEHGQGHGDSIYAHYMATMFPLPYANQAPATPAPAHAAPAAPHRGRRTFNWKRWLTAIAAAVAAVVIASYVMQPLTIETTALLQGNRDAHKATLAVCGGDAYRQTDYNSVASCYGAWLSAHKDPNAQIAAKEMERRLAGSCVLLSVSTDLKDKNLAQTMGDNGVPCTNESPKAEVSGQALHVPGNWWRLGFFALLSGLAMYSYSGRRARAGHPLSGRTKAWIFFGLIVFLILFDLWVF